ncbi:hypothetical protein Q5P01_011618 [Channa striata]|uniref:UPAR/Ly6 domain-containing protein n=1 Tax=Channa striata TaxID=64152 RepID=A0AA88MV61_CHASR|nr:hypothetical protein Q5P01_011618 [Channa striata]
MLNEIWPLLLLCLLPAVIPLFCVFPAISPWDCISFPLKCPPGQLCVSSRAVGVKGDLRVVLCEKSCILPSMCGLTGENHAMGLNFTFTNECCNTNLCNGAATPDTHNWTGTLFTLVISHSVW